MKEETRERLLLRFLTPGGEVVRAEADAVRLPVPDGSLGILPRHAPMLAVLACGQVRYRKDGGEFSFPVSGGIARISGQEVLLLSDSGEKSPGIN